jgi:hypothetical protein
MLQTCLNEKILNYVEDLSGNFSSSFWCYILEMIFPRPLRFTFALCFPNPDFQRS